MIALAMSGGIDSCVAARLLKEQGRDVLGIHMRHSFHKTAGTDDATEENDARKAAEKLGIPFEVFDADPVFPEVVETFIDGYLAGMTPNPCVFCNRKIKFGKLFEFAESLGADTFATGHYARIDKSDPANPQIRKAKDPGKDQSYVLFGIEKKRLARIEFPIGNYSKSEVRGIAAMFGVGMQEKKESQEICFVPDHKHPEFIRENRPGTETSGDFVSTSGQIIGKHDGYERFTIGQRKGMKVGFGERVYVVRIDAETKNVVLGSLKDLERKSLVAAETNWHIPIIFDVPFRCDVKIRYRNAAKPAVVVVHEDGTMLIEFDEPISGIAPGQYAVCYDGDFLLGGGKITAAFE